jgi:hypothetical protein
MHASGRIGSDQKAPETDTPRVPAAPPAALDLLSLQRSAGNRAVAGMLSRARVDRFVATSANVLDRTSGWEAILDAVATYLVATEPQERALGLEHVRQELVDTVDLELGEGFPEPVLRATAASMAELAHPMRNRIRVLRDERHMQWLNEARMRFETQLAGAAPNADLRGRTIRTDAEMRRQKDAQHYRELDAKIGLPDMLWRFTSNPQSEVIKIDKDVGFGEVVSIVGAHTGGNKKDDGRVRTLSFGRNLAALIGVAYSKGGDPNVAEIAVRAEYLFGVPMASLAGQGITAHPAESRLIGIFETEYILLATPGDPPRKLDDIAPIKLRNPFKGMDGTGGSERLLEGKLLASEQVESAVGKDTEKPAKREAEPSSGKVFDAPEGFSATVREHARRIQAAATEQSGLVRMEEGADGVQIDAALRKFQEDLKAYDGKQAKPKSTGPRY